MGMLMLTFLLYSSESWKQHECLVPGTANGIMVLLLKIVIAIEDDN